MPRVWSLIALLVVALPGWTPAWAAAPSYRFQVPELQLDAFVEPDASVRLEYEIVLVNLPGAHPIDVVDIGLPHREYSLRAMSASVDGRPLSAIRRSTYIDVGVEVHLGRWAIPPGGRGVFRFACRMPDMVYQDTTDPERASLQIRPTWFDPRLHVGDTMLRVAIHLPAGVEPEEVTYQQESLRYDALVLLDQGGEKHVVAVWERPKHRLSEANPKFSVSFPKRVMRRVVRITAFGLFLKWFSESRTAQWVSGTALLTALAWLFFRFSGGTGWIVYVLLAGGAVLVMRSHPGLHLLLWPLTGLLVGLNEWRRARRAHRYLPPLATVEGGGIKRGLTAPQAAVLLELPLGKVLALVLFGLLKKGVLRQNSADPLVVSVAPEYQKPRRERRRAAARRGVVIRDYEQPFIDLLIGWDKPVEERDFSRAMGQLVQSTARAMRGFDLSDTKAYYRRIVADAWRQAEAVGEVRQRTEAVDRHFEWMVLDEQWPGRFRRWGARGYAYRPVWTRTAPVPAGADSRTTFGEVASSFAGWAENTAGRLASAVEPAKMGLKLPGRAAIDLSGVDRVTADVFEALASSGGGRGGSAGGGCACACAGCACACACAGGGR